MTGSPPEDDDRLALRVVGRNRKLGMAPFLMQPQRYGPII